MGLLEMEEAPGAGLVFCDVTVVVFIDERRGDTGIRENDCWFWDGGVGGYHGGGVGSSHGGR